MGIIAYGVANYLEKLMRIREGTVINTMKKFVETLIKVVGTEYPRAPNLVDIVRLLEMAEARGFIGVLGVLTICPRGQRSALQDKMEISLSNKLNCWVSGSTDLAFLSWDTWLSH